MAQEYERRNKQSSEVIEGYLTALFDFYVSGYYLDLKRETYYAIGQMQEYYEQYNAEDDWSRMDDYIRECINEEDQALITEVSRIDYIRERLKKVKNYSVEVRDHGTGTERWYRFTVMRCNDEDHAAIVFTDVTDQVLQRQELERLSAELEEQNKQLEENQAQLEESASEQEAQMEEIAALNTQLQENQARLEEASAEQEAQLEETQALNQELQESKDRISESFGMIEGLSQEYHTIWLVSKETSKMRLIRSSGVSTIQNAVQMGKDLPEFDKGFDKYINTYVEPEDRERMRREIAFAEILRQLNEHPGELYAVNYLRRDDSGHVGYHQIAFANADTADGKKQFVYGFRDIDKIVKEEQKKKEELQKALLLAQDASMAMANAGYGMWHIILKDGIAPRMQVNEKMAELLGIAGQKLTEEELYNAWYNQIVPDAIPSVQASVGEMLDGKFSENTYQWVHPTKGVIYVRCGGTAQKLEDGTNVLSGYHADVTDIVYEEKKHNEELERAKKAAEAASKAKSSFLFNMSHDIRTPMNAIIGFTDLIEKHYDEREKCMDYVHKTQEANKLMLSLINNVLEMARIESGKEQLDETVCQTGVVTHEILSIFEDKIRQKNIALTSNVAIHTPYMLCDQPKLREICLNILSNAVKYTPEGGSIHIEMRELPCERPGYATIQGICADTGIGMSKEFLPRLFEEFAREQTATESRQQGTGLGMPIVKKLVDLMGGTIEVESELGKGTTFTVSIDLKIVDTPPEALLEKQGNLEAPAHTDFAGKRILLAEDNDLNAEIAMEILSEVGFEVERAADGVICVDMLQKAERGYYDLILMDVQMPNMDGYQATRVIRSMNDPGRSRIPIVAMTANAFDQDKKNALNAGMDGHLAKPIEIPKLMETLSEILK